MVGQAVEGDLIRVWRGERVLVEEQVLPATVVVEGNTIKDVLPGRVEVPGAVEVVDVPGDRILMAGLVDSHVHINEPGRTAWEGFDTATRAAAVGGVTTLVDMPLNALPPTTSPENLATKVAAARGQCWVDVGFWGGVIPGNAHHLKAMVTLGVPGFKCFLIHSGVDEFPAVTRDQAREALVQLRGTGATLLFHAECELEDEEDLVGDPGEYNTFLNSRPPAMELSAIQLVVDICRETRVPCHIVHLSAASALPIVKAAKAEGLPLTVETCHHYLSLTAEEVPTRATQYKCCPPIRGRSNKEELWEAVKTGVIDMLVSDHSPCTPDLKQPGHKDFMAAWGGISSLQFGFSLAWTQAKERQLTLPFLHKLMGQSPAQLAGLQEQKGQLKKGFDADLVIFAPDETHLVEVGDIQHKNKLTPYLGRKLRGVVHSTVVGGKEVYSKKEGFKGAPSGQLLLPERSKL